MTDCYKSFHVIHKTVGHIKKMIFVVVYLIFCIGLHVIFGVGLCIFVFLVSIYNSALFLAFPRI